MKKQTYILFFALLINAASQTPPARLSKKETTALRALRNIAGSSDLEKKYRALISSHDKLHTAEAMTDNAAKRENLLKSQNSLREKLTTLAGHDTGIEPLIQGLSDRMTLTKAFLGNPRQKTAPTSNSTEVSSDTIKPQPESSRRSKSVEEALKQAKLLRTRGASRPARHTEAPATLHVKSEDIFALPGTPDITPIASSHSPASLASSTEAHSFEPPHLVDHTPSAFHVVRPRYTSTAPLAQHVPRFVRNPAHSVESPKPSQQRTTMNPLHGIAATSKEIEHTMGPKERPVKGHAKARIPEHGAAREKINPLHSARR